MGVQPKFERLDVRRSVLEDRYTNDVSFARADDFLPLIVVAGCPLAKGTLEGSVDKLFSRFERLNQLNVPISKLVEAIHG